MFTSEQKCFNQKGKMINLDHFVKMPFVVETLLSSLTNHTINDTPTVPEVHSAYLMIRQRIPVCSFLVGYVYSVYYVSTSQCWWVPLYDIVYENCLSALTHLKFEHHSVRQSVV